jgi:isoleucyl-tRNA synthetase
VLRLWVAATDYRNEMSVSDEILKRSADAYRRIRNTARFLLGNLAGFDPAVHALPNDQMLLLDQWAVQRAFELQQKIQAAYARYDFPEIVQLLSNFCTVDLGSLYLDVTKDRLYTMREDSRGRRSAQTAMFRIAEAFVRWITPILSFTAEDIWRYLPGQREESVLFATWYEGLALLPEGAALNTTDFDQLLAMRDAVSKVLEPMRANGEIGAALQARIELHVDEAMLARLKPVADELRFLFITSEVVLHPSNTRPESASKVEGLNAFIVGTASSDSKCIRCWHYRPDVGSHPEHPEICGRCVGNVDGPGEDRRWF